MKPLAVYIHWPFCLSKCPYCDFNSHVREGVEHARWRAALLAELEWTAKKLPGHKVSSIFFGGGTPSLMEPETVCALINRTQELWECEPGIEITLEANPTSVEALALAAFEKAGVNRVSLGVQSLRQKELSFLGRGHNVAEAVAAVKLARDHFARYSFDLIYARPNQSVAQWEDELGEGLALCGGHLSLYQLTIEENTAFYTAYAKGAFAMPDEETAEALYRTTEAMTKAHGLAAYEVSNYAKPGQESRHNLAYWLGEDYAGIGPGAHGRITLESSRFATLATKSPERWLTSVEANANGLESLLKVDSTQEAQERLLMGLRLQEGIDLAALKMRTGLDLREHINAKKLALYRAQGLLTADENRLQTTLAGRLVLTQLSAELLD